MPKIEAKGSVGGTAFFSDFKNKGRAQVMHIHNIDVLDGLSNGTRGELVAVEKDVSVKVNILLIKFDEQYKCAQKRLKNPGFLQYCKKNYHNLFKYSSSSSIPNCCLFHIYNP